MTVLFLYTELADYFIKCCEKLSESAQVHIVRWPVNQEAPFNFNFSESIKVYNRKDYSRNKLQKLAESINPDIIICSGWVDKDYLFVVKKYFKKIPTVLALDTHWRGDIKQYMATLLSRFFLMRIFSNAWVPGNAQVKYANRLGFKKQTIKTGFYCCDLEKFNAIFNKTKKTRAISFPKKIIYVGRYYAFKGVEDLWKAFIELQEEYPSEWELYCLGTGNVAPVQHPKIKHFGFIQPNQLEPIIKECGVFVLPSRFEPWGVVVQEYAASGFPLLLSREVGSGEAFLSDTVNGYTFPAGDVAAIKDKLKKIMGLSSKELFLMSEISHEQAQNINPKNWALTVFEICNEHRKN